MEKTIATLKNVTIIVAFISTFYLGYMSAIATIQTAMFGEALGYGAELEGPRPTPDTPVFHTTNV